MRLCYQTFKVTKNETEMLLIFFILKLLICESLNFYKYIFFVNILFLFVNGEKVFWYKEFIKN